AIKDYFRSINRDPTDCEIEILAQTWSEHCVHKTFRAKIMADGKEKLPFLKRLQEATEEVDNPLVLSAFVDNSGVIEFFDGMAICGKVETHNSPSAIEPYGGAMTGSGGVFRDIMGTGQGAKVVASTDIFCLAHPDLDHDEIPAGCLHPQYILRRVVEGVRDYGNRMGVPTNNGSLHFHRDFRAKPTIIVGAYGILPVSQCKKGEPKPGDLVVTIGGRTGRDGIHGATFSSGAMTDRTVSVNASAVQIGHPIEEKRVSDLIRVCREKGIIRAITDCGAGGFASAIGEMGETTGVKIELDKAPLKYPGLDPWEILLSESQERMVVAIKEDNLRELMKICKDLNVEAAVLGEFSDTKHFVATYHGEIVLNLDMNFLHDGLPERVLEASWVGNNYPEPSQITATDFSSLYVSVMSHLNVCSKEPVVRVYDHGAQGTSALPPFSGVAEDGPNDAAVFVPLRGKEYGAIISHGLNPILNKIDPYWGGIWASAEAVSNAVAAGASRKDLALIDNFIWPFPTRELLGALDRAVDACVDFSKATGMPFISGKDSLSSTYHGGDGETIEIPPVLCISVFGRVENVRHTVSADFKSADSSIVLVGQRDINEMGGSVLYDLNGYTGNNVPKIDLEMMTRVFDTLHEAIISGAIKACHDISEGGLAAAVAEMCFGGGVGASLRLPEGKNPLKFMFNETAGCFVVEVDKATDCEDLFKDVPYCPIGGTQPDQTIVINYGNHGNEEGDKVDTVSLEVLKSAWQMPMKEVFK
ncbi:MAG TPA: AIR synthase-related protein, partial [Clostridia bacterium]|nr:AIR synthase-related protein [Clostridia bacterium]